MNTKQLATAVCFFAVSLLVSGCGPGQVLGPTLTPTPGRVEGSVTWSGTPVTNSTVNLLWNEGGLVVRTNPANQKAQIDENGQFAFENVTPGYYAIEITIDRTNDSCVLVATVKVEAGDQVKMNFIIPDDVGSVATLPDLKAALICQ